MNIFRIPLNCVVVLILLQDLSLSIIFKCCILFLVLATICMFYLEKLITTTNESNSVIALDDENFTWINEPYDLIIFSKYSNNNIS
jgi:hypothetical protein